MTSVLHKFDYLDAIRGWAILGVMLVHTSQAFGQPVIVQPWLKAGAYGVQLFFVASALTLLLSWHQRNDGIAAFWIRRLFRIAPLYWMAMIFYGLYHGLGPRGVDPDGTSLLDLLLVGTFTNGWHPYTINSVVPGGWSIAVEMTFYIVFPLLATGILGLLSSLVLFATATVIAALIYTGVASHWTAWLGADQSVLARSFAGSWFFNQLPAFAVGFLVYFALSAGRSVKRRKATLLGGIGISALVLLPLLPLPGGVVPAAFAAAFGAFVFALANGAFSFLTGPWVRQLGVLSYSAYLVHFAVVDLVASIIPRAGVTLFPGFVLVVVTTALVSLGLHRLPRDQGTVRRSKRPPRLPSCRGSGEVA